MRPSQLGATGYFQKPGDLAGFMQLGRSCARRSTGSAAAAGKIPPNNAAEAGFPD